MRTARAATVGFIVGVMLVWGTAGQAVAYPVGREAGERPVLFLGNESLPPMNFMKDGKPTGVVVDLARAVAKHMPRTVEIRLMNWTEAQRLVVEGRADALLQINPSPERLKIYDFSDLLLTSEFMIFTSTDRVGVFSLSDLRELKVGAEGMGLPIFLLRKVSGINLVMIPDFVQGFRMLATGAVDAVVADRWVGSYLLAENNVQGVKMAEEPIDRSQSAIAVKKGNAKLLGEINAALADIRRDGTYDKIIQSWRPKEVVFKTREQLRQETRLIVSISAVLIAALVSIVALIREIRRRKRVEASLRESEQRFRMALRNAPVSVSVQDRGLRYVWAHNQRTARPEEIIGRLDSDIFTSEEAKRLGEIKRRVLEEKVEVREQMWFDRPDGRMFLDVYFVPVRDEEDRITGVGVATLDLTPIKRAEEALATSEEKFRTAFANASIGFAMSSVDGHFLDANPAYCRITGYPIEELRALTFQKLIHPDDYAENMKLIDLMMAGRIPDFVVENRYALKDGGTAWVRKSVSLVRDAEGTPQWIISLAENVTQRKRAEDELRRSRDELDLRVRERTAELTISNKALVEYAAKLERLNQELQEFAFAASHDLQEPLRKIQTFSDLAKTRCAPALDSAGQDYLERVINSAGRMRHLLDDLLQFSRIATRPEAHKVISLGKIAREAAGVFERMIEEAGAVVEIDGLPEIEADGAQMLRLFQNLIGNSLKFRSDGKPRIMVSAGKDGQGWCEIMVRDNGIGFDQEFATRIFKPFQSLHPRGEYEGTGMGLAMCRKIVERHGGSIRAESESGKGSTFIISLPVKQEKWGATSEGKGTVGSSDG